MKIIYIGKETNKHLFIPLCWSLKFNLGPFLLVTTSITNKSFGAGGHAGKFENHHTTKCQTHTDGVKLCVDQLHGDTY